MNLLLSFIKSSKVIFIIHFYENVSAKMINANVLKIIDFVNYEIMANQIEIYFFVNHACIFLFYGAYNFVNQFSTVI